MMPNKRGVFRAMAERSANWIGSPNAFIASIVLVAAWAISGFAFHFSDAWQLIINTATNVITLFIVFLIQNTQNRDAKAMHLKLDELIRAVGDARTNLVGLEKMPDEAIARLQQQFERLQRFEARKKEKEKAGGAAAS